MEFWADPYYRVRVQARLRAMQGTVTLALHAAIPFAREVGVGVIHGAREPKVAAFIGLRWYCWLCFGMLHLVARIRAKRVLRREAPDFRARVSVW